MLPALPPNPTRDELTRLLQALIEHVNVLCALVCLTRVELTYQARLAQTDSLFEAEETPADEPPDHAED